ncbi:MAG: sugar phosphate isomerase/epimerase [Planctomycetia bacterium]|nr:sugar phosphate isomerase/epimerase [Planctomycetia bacterium]
MDTSRLSVPAAAFSTDLRRALRLARDLGVHGIELDARSGIDPEQLTQTGLRQIRKWLGDEGVTVSAVSFRTRGGYADGARLEGRIAATKAALKLAHDLGAGVVLNHVGDIPEEAAGPHWNLLVDVLTDIGNFGQHVGATLCAEAGRAAPADLARLISTLPAGSLTCDIVTGSLVVHGHDPAAAVETLAAHVAAVHATDAIAGPFAGRGRAVILGTGQVDLATTLATLEECGYRGWIGLEPVDERASRTELAAAIASLVAL